MGILNSKEKCRQVLRMLSRLASRAAALAPSLTVQAQGRVVALYSTAVEKATEKENKPAVYCDIDDLDYEPNYQPDVTNLPIEIQIRNWEKANALFYGPERDLKNFPHPVPAETAPPTRWGFVPESFFNNLYSKTGVSGPYVIGIGGIMYILSKEIVHMDHTFTEFAFMTFALYMGATKLGKMAANYLDTKSEDYCKEYWFGRIDGYKDAIKRRMVASEMKIKQSEATSVAYDAQKEMVDMALETEYRARLSKLHAEVKKRLDYQLAFETSKKRIQQEHMANWIIDGVIKGITPKP